MASLPPDPKSRNKGAGPLKRHSAVGVRNAFKFRVLFNQVMMAYSKRNSGKHSCNGQLSITVTNVGDHRLMTGTLDSGIPRHLWWSCWVNSWGAHGVVELLESKRESTHDIKKDWSPPGSLKGIWPPKM